MKRLECTNAIYDAIAPDGGSRNDCGVRTLALLTGIDYCACADYLADIRGRNGRLKADAWEARYVELGLMCIHPRSMERWRTLGRFVKTFPVGTYGVEVKGHLLIVKDGIIHDWKSHGARCPVYSAWYVPGSVPAHPLPRG